VTGRSTRLLAALLILSAAPLEAWAQTTPAPSSTGSRFWIVGGGGFSVARAGCTDPAAPCDPSGVFANSRSILLDAGLRVSPKVDAGVELLWVSTPIVGEAPIRTTFILGVGQLRPWDQLGFFLRAGMGISFAGNGLYSPVGEPIAPPFTTNALGLTYGTGWIIGRSHRRALQIHATHHVAAIGELTTTSGESIKNVVANYWTIGAAVVLR
jgi:hypothetical protein